MIDEFRGYPQTLERTYQAFLNDIRKETIECALKQGLPTDPTSVVPWEVIGIEFAKCEIEEEYGKDVYKKANEEVPYKKFPIKTHRRK